MTRAHLIRNNKKRRTEKDHTSSPLLLSCQSILTKKEAEMQKIPNDRTSLLPIENNGLERTLSGAGAADTSWYKISFVIVANFLGTGVLSLPHATASLGWIFAYVALFVCTMGALFSGVLFSRLNDRFPEARVYADVAREAWGQRGDSLVRATSYTYMGGG